MKSFTTLFVSTLALLPYVCAHGFVSQLIIDGKAYEGNDPNQGETQPSPIRLIDDPSPVKGANNPAVNCGPNAKIAQVVAPANPGSNMTFSWHSGDDAKPDWPHDTGPMITYMAECSGTTCDKFDAANAKWFKIHEVGRQPNQVDWVQKLIMGGGSLSVFVPKDLKAGDYLVRHEIIALHLAKNPGGAEFYPSCSQIRVGGNGSSVANNTVSLPGAYKDTDPGILVDVFSNPTDPYVFPGPPVASLISASGAVSNASNDTDPSSTASSASSAPSATASPTNKSCYMMVDERGIKRRYSRIMRSVLPRF